MAALSVNPSDSPRFVERFPLRPGRPGNPRRKAKGASCPTRSGAEGGPRGASSLDNSNQLATTYADHFKAIQTKEDRYRSKTFLQARLLRSIEKIVRALEWHLEDLKDRESSPELEKEIRGVLRKIKRRQRDYERLSQCHSQWVIFRANCCATARAVPINCNHRLCLLCSAARSEKYRERVRVLFDRFEHPVFLTLTIPNVANLSKRTYGSFRRAWNRLRKEHSGWIRGGIFALETTYNFARLDAPWHVHAHVLIDSATALPVCACHPSGRGRHRRHRPGCAFLRFKKRLEFDWLCLTGGHGLGWRCGDFDYWLHTTERDDWQSDAARYEWNRRNRRIIDIRRVTDRQKAAVEVLKYITKSADFCGIPEAVDRFADVVKGTRMLQPFGSCYGFEFPEDLNTWDHLECSCGKKEFVRWGVVYREGVVMEPSGFWSPRPEIFPIRGAPTGAIHYQGEKTA